MGRIRTVGSWALQETGLELWLKVGSAATESDACRYGNTSPQLFLSRGPRQRQLTDFLLPNNPITHTIRLGARSQAVLACTAGNVARYVSNHVLK